MSPSIHLLFSLFELAEQLEIAVVARRPDRARFHGLTHRAARLVHLAAVAKPAVTEEGTKLEKAVVEIAREEVPHTDLAQPRRVDDETAIGERMQRRAHGRVAPLVHRLADLAHAEVEPRIDGVEQR